MRRERRDGIEEYNCLITGSQKTMFKPDRSREGIIRECGIDMYTLLYLKWITNKDLLYNTGNSAQYYVTT